MPIVSMTEIRNALLPGLRKIVHNISASQYAEVFGVEQHEQSIDIAELIWDERDKGVLTFSRGLEDQYYASDDGNLCS